MAESDVKLLGSRPSPFVNRVQFALNLKSVDYEFIQQNLAADKSELLLKSNPVHKKIPVLIHGDKPICESLVIVQYIDEKWPEGPSLFPSNPYGRATARFWAAYIDDKWFPVLKEISAVKQESKAAVLEEIVEGLTLLEDVLVRSNDGNGGYFGGDDLGYVDIVLGSYLGFLKVGEITANVKILDETRSPAMVKWAEKFSSHKAVEGTLMEAEELLNLLGRKRAKSAAEASSK